MTSLSERLYRLLKNHPTIRTKDALAQELGCSRSMLYHYEQGNPDPPEPLLNKVLQMEIALGIDSSTSVESTGHVDAGPSGNAARAALPKVPKNGRNLPFPVPDESRRIGVIGWAHAGQAAGYEEVPASWQRTIPTDCRDPLAFAVTLEGDSMEPMFRDGDLLVLMPSERIHNGCIAVVRLASDGVLLRRLEVRGPRMRLVPLNPRYEVEELDCEQVSWAYPVWGRWSQVWK